MKENDVSRFSDLPVDELERRRLKSIGVMEERARSDFERHYQERCDRFYWGHGRCCAGCDHWSSEAGDFGECMSAPPVSGADVVRSLGFTFCSYTPPPGQPFTKRDHVCGAFKDDFDWQTLDPEYRQRIGAP
ncbi:hypothetical protein [Sphingomonas soli]|uniref:hypothetical protein n=1 Tax=Sphingomonas soli TaxID=266127 RepID=UPI0012ED44C1|nr:hypothetical protein [Sphingomonas soli]